MFVRLVLAGSGNNRLVITNSNLVVSVGTTLSDTVLECGGALPLSASASISEMLLFALKKQPIEQQQDHGTDDRHDPARWLSSLVPTEGLAEVSGDERASDA